MVKGTFEGTDRGMSSVLAWWHAFQESMGPFMFHPLPQWNIGGVVSEEDAQ